jgi:GH15 family glucan-1,4-alpha-glucosidase
MPLVGFLPVEDERVRGTIAAIEKHLLRDGLVQRYDTNELDDGVNGHEGAFLACSFWLVSVWNLCGRRQEARELFERLLALRNDVGLLSEEYDTQAKRQVGNFPQAWSHIALVNSAFEFTRAVSPGEQRSQSKAAL